MKGSSKNREFFIFQRLCYLELWNTPSSSAATVKIKPCLLISGLHLPVLWEHLPALWGQENTQQFEFLLSQVVIEWHALGLVRKLSHSQENDQPLPLGSQPLFFRK